MKKLIVALAATTFMASAAFAETIEGVVKEFSQEAGTLTLEDGKSFTIPQGVALPPDLAAGQTVSIETDSDDPMKIDSVTTSSVAQ